MFGFIAFETSKGQWIGQERKGSPKRKFIGWGILWTSGRISGRMSQATNFLKVARRQREFWHEIFWGLQIFLRKMLRNFPETFEPVFVGPKKSRKVPAKFPPEKFKEITDELLRERREKTLSSSLRAQEIKHFYADILDLNARTSMTKQAATLD